MVGMVTHGWTSLAVNITLEFMAQSINKAIDEDKNMTYLYGDTSSGVTISVL